MMELWQKLRALRERAGITQEELAKALPGRITRTSVGLWESDNDKHRTEPRKGNREALAAYYGISMADLMSSIGVESNVTEAAAGYRAQIRKLPIIDIIKAGSPTEYADPYESGDSNDWVPVIDTLSEFAFALRVNGNSMTQDLREPSYPHGAIIVCEPDLIGDVRIGDGVVARMLIDDTRVFKSFDVIDGMPVLVPLNKQYPVIHDEFEVLAVVVQMIVQRR